VKPRLPNPSHMRPWFWPWPSGQRLGLTDDHVISSDALLFLWNCLAPTRPTGLWDPSPLLRAAGAESLDNKMLVGALDLLKAYRLTWFDPQWAAWCKLDPQDKAPSTKPPVRNWPTRVPMTLADPWWYLQPLPNTPSWTLLQAQRQCPALTAEAIELLNKAGKAKGTVRV